MARALIIDPDGEGGLDLAIRAGRFGHQAKYYLRKSPKTEHIGRGLVDVVDDFRSWWRWADLVLSTGNSVYLRDMDNLQKSHPVALIAACPDVARWEINRTVGQEVLRKHGIETLPGKEFTDYDAAIAHVKKHDKRFVSKPAGDEADKSLSYVSKSPSDMVYMLERWKRLGKLKSSFVLQDFVAGTEMGIAGWFGPGGWNEGWEENFEFKKFMNDDLGVSTGEQGTVARYVKNSKLARKMLLPLTSTLEKHGYVGDIDVNCIIDDKGRPWPLEFTCRLGWPAFHLQNALVQGDPIEWLIDLANGKDAKAMTLDKIAVGVVLSIPDYPYSHMTQKEIVGVPIYGLTESLWRHWHPCQMKLQDGLPNVVQGVHVKMPMPATAGDYVGVMTAVADTVKDAALSCYRRLGKIELPSNPMWRTDIGKRLARQLPKIQQHGYAIGMMYSPN